MQRVAEARKEPFLVKCRPDFGSANLRGGRPVSQSGSLIRNISDTAHWAAVYRARETDRRDALFRDPFARRLAGARGEQIADSLPFGNRSTWAWVTRTYLFDQFIIEQVQQGVDMVINLAAGLDARPYRMALPSSLQWIEVDLPEIRSEERRGGKESRSRETATERS